MFNLDTLTTGFWAFGTAFKYVYPEVKLYLEDWEKVIPLLGDKPFPEHFQLLEEGGGSSYPSACNVTVLPSRHLVIVNSAFRTLSESSQRFVLLHECGHIHHEDNHMYTIVSLMTLIASHIFFPSHPFIAYVLIKKVVGACLGAIQERRADAFAIHHASDVELEGGIAILKEKQIKRAQSWESATTIRSKASSIIAALDYYILEGHPLESSRINSIQREIHARENRYDVLLKTC